MQAGHSPLACSDSRLTCRMRLSHRSMTVSGRLIAVTIAADDLDRLVGLKRGDHVDDRPQDAGRVAGGRRARRRRVAASGSGGRRSRRARSSSSAPRPPGSRRRPRESLASATTSLSSIRVSKLSVPSTITSMPSRQLLDVRVVDVGDERLDRDLGVDLPQLVRRGDRLGQSGRHVVLVVTAPAAAGCSAPENRDRRSANSPTPARASVLAITDPSAPQPQMSIRDASNRR